MASRDGEITEGEFYLPLKRVGSSKTLGLEGLETVFVPIVNVEFNNCFRQCDHAVQKEQEW